MVRYSYYFNSSLDLHVVMITRNNSDGTVAIRPVAAYYQKKTAQDYIARVNAYIESGRKGAAPRFNPPVRFFNVPDWWAEKFPNWDHMVKRA